MSEIPGRSRHALPDLQPPVCATTGLMRCNNGATTSLHFPVAVMPERNANRLAPATTEPGRDTAIPGKFL
jgi:hypothetical protein